MKPNIKAPTPSFGDSGMEQLSVDTAAPDHTPLPDDPDNTFSGIMSRGRNAHVDKAGSVFPSGFQLVQPK